MYEKLRFIDKCNCDSDSRRTNSVVVDDEEGGYIAYGYYECKKCGHKYKSIAKGDYNLNSDVEE